jgi:oligopeptide/dipeptide ABC transporter ATP-binding protein
MSGGTTPATVLPAEPLLSVEGLRIMIPTGAGAAPAVDGVSFSIAPGEILGLVGESGCGKTLTGLSIPGLLPAAARIVAGSIRFCGEDLLRLPEERLRRLRGRDIGLVFQEPASALDPVRTIGSQIAEPLRLHRGLSRRAALEEAARLLQALAVPEPARRVREYPHQLSGGMRQRVLIAAAIAGGPSLVVADEPTSALDATVRREILGLLRGLQRKARLSILLISHDLGVVASLAQRVAVMYCGRIVEEARTTDLFAAPRHPYTQGLLNARPRLDGAVRPGEPLPAIEGTVPSPGALPPGCAFEPRCGQALPRCRSERPALAVLQGGSRLACFLDSRVERDLA